MNKWKWLGLVLVLSFSSYCYFTQTPELRKHNHLHLALEASKKSNKPLFIYFTAYTLCSDEFRIYTSNRKIVQKLNRDFETLIVFVDDKGSIWPPDLRVIQQDLGLTPADWALEDNGKFHTWLEQELYKEASQPLYLITDQQLKPLVEPWYYSAKNVEKFLGHLNQLD